MIYLHLTENQAAQEQNRQKTPLLNQTLNKSAIGENVNERCKKKENENRPTYIFLLWRIEQDIRIGWQKW